ncbi:MAG: VCBS repeat-containing protein [Deltaproteobacteria bacterium]|nr:VCBS repeat-containing protein [Candidatus Zymogenaceae bacterium]
MIVRKISILTVVICLIFAMVGFAQDDITVAIVPFTINSPEDVDYLEGAIYDMMASRLSVDDRIAVMERTKVERLLGGNYSGTIDEDNAVTLGNRLGADYIILGSLTKLGETFSMDAKMYSVSEGERATSVYAQGSGLDSLIPKVNEFARNMNFKILGYVPAEGVAGYMGESVENPNFIYATRDLMSKTDFRKSPFWDIQIKGVDVGDVDGDQLNETVVIDKNEVWIYKRGKEEFELFMTFKGRPINNFLTVDVLDLNGNGYDEIFISNVDKGRVRSLVIEYDPASGEFERIDKNISFFMRSFAFPGEEPILLGQKMGMGVDDVYHGDLFRVDYIDGKYEKGQMMKFPGGTAIYGTSLPVDIDFDGAAELVVVDEQNHLRIISSDGSTEWKSDEFWGGVVNYFLTKEGEDRLSSGADDVGETYEAYVQGRIFITDLNNDNNFEILINKNISETMNLLPRFRLYETSEIYNLSWDGFNLSENWQSRVIDGYVADYQLKDIDSDGINELVVAVVFSFEMTALIPAKSGVLIYELNF